MEDYVGRLGRNPRYADWQVVQVLQVIQWAHGECLGEDWVREVDWFGLEEACREVTRSHEMRWWGLRLWADGDVGALGSGCEAVEAGHLRRQ